MKIADRIWNELTTNLYKGIYTNIHNARIRKLSDGINLFTTFATSGAVAGWAIWRDIPELWAVIIGINQLLNLSKPYIGKIRDYELYHELEMFYNEQYFDLDNLWLKISLGDLTNDEINTEYNNIHNKYFNISKKFLKVRIESNKSIVTKSENEWNIELVKYGVSNVSKTE